MNSLVSVIVPIYNVEKYLRKCLNSIINQTYKNIEIICVDDGSPDNSIDILNEFAEKDERIKIIRQENQGLSGARNTGIDNAVGRYIMFIDSDDWVELNMVELMVNKIERDNLDIVICGQYNHYISKDNEVIKEIDLKKLSNSIFMNYRDYFIENYSFKYPFGSSWNKLYKIKIIRENKLYFAEKRLHEDLLFVFKYISVIKKIGIVKKCLYHYIVTRTDSITNRINKNEIKDVLFTLEELKKYLHRNFLESLEFNEYMFGWIFRAVLFKKDIYKMQEFDRRIEILKNNLDYKEICKIILKNTKRLKYKLFIKTLYFNNNFFKLFIRLNYFLQR
ncbi:MAG: glycosyltransferase family 2 protein [Fusobacterium sp.]